MNKMYKNVEDELIIERALDAFGCQNQEQLADLFHISPQDLSNRKRKGTLLKLIEKESFRREISYDWIKTGKGARTFGHGTGHRISEPNEDYFLSQSVNQSGKISDSLAKTAAILESKSIFSDALQSNINAFHYALIIEKKLNIALQKIDDLEEWKKTVEQRLLAVK
ncbi:MAG: helix-turn-helix domain-containing protein [Phycisphaerales bacterium]